MARVLIVEDYWVWATAIESQIATLPGIRVVGMASSADEGIEMAERLRPDLALIDLLLGDDSGLRVARVIRQRGLPVITAIITTDPTPWAVREADEAGVQAFVSKDDLIRKDQVATLVGDLLGRRRIRSDSVRSMMAHNHSPYGLTTQEHEIISCWARGLGNNEVAQRLSVSQQTIRNKTSAIGRKLGVSGRLEIVAKARNEHLLNVFSESPHGLE